MCGCLASDESEGAASAMSRLGCALPCVVVFSVVSSPADVAPNSHHSSSFSSMPSTHTVLTALGQIEEAMQQGTGVIGIAIDPASAVPAGQQAPVENDAGGAGTFL